MRTVKTEQTVVEQKTIKREESVVRTFAEAFETGYGNAEKFLQAEFNKEPERDLVGVLPKLRSIVLQGKTPFRKFLIEIGRDLGDGQGKRMFLWYGLEGEEREYSVTMQRFLQRHPKGTYLILSMTHIFCVRDGKIISSDKAAKRGKTPIKHAFKVEDASSYN